ncbi:hypothetical protein SKAU_G00033980 [Synaphobranchus kaupii]|uniref:Uncharacterized protein n=1 Tax=Synaphobranchus kaupii TaxID=118154 RepID=A0A9Q1JFL6_SYNKA|nr:hypothetical protein SKAU_G00033980 [Synaphobranchus kaupii]
MRGLPVPPWEDRSDWTSWPAPVEAARVAADVSRNESACLPAARADLNRCRRWQHRENIDNRQSRYEAAGEQWEQERPGKEMEMNSQFGGAGDEREREQ